MPLTTFASGANVSEWISTAPSPKVLRHELRKAAKQQLLEEASQLVPDSAALTKILTDYKIPFADLAPVQSELQSMLSDYINNYSKSPFTAFTKEMRDKAKSMQYLVNSPRLKQAEQDYLLFNKSVEQADKDQLLGNINYQNGKVPVIREVSGQRRRILVNVDDVLDTDVLITSVARDAQLMENFVGFSNNNGDQFKIEMSSHKDIEDKIQKYFTNLGHNANELLTQDGTVGSKNNYAQVESAYNALTSGAGLSNSDWNTLFSVYYTDKINNGGTLPSQKEARADILNYIKAVAKGKRINEVKGLGVNPDGSKGTGQGLKNALNLDPLTAASSGLTAPVSSNEIIHQDGKGIWNSLNGQLNNFATYTNGRTVEVKKGDKRPSKALSDNSLMPYINEAYIPRLDNGGMEPIDNFASIQKAIIIDDNRKTATLALPVDGNGKPASAEMINKLTRYGNLIKQDPMAALDEGVTPDMMQYMKPVTNQNGQIVGYDINYQKFFSVPVKVPVGGNSEVDKISEKLSRSGYLPEDMNSDEAAEYTKHNDAGIDATSTMGFNLPGTDNVYKPSLLLKVPDDATARMIAGGDVKIPQEAGTAGIMSQTGNTIMIPLSFTNPDVKARRQMIKSNFAQQYSLKR